MRTPLHSRPRAQQIYMRIEYASTGERNLTVCLCACAVSDLAPGQSGVDDMKMLEQKAQQLAAEAEQDKPRPKDKILFVRLALLL